MCNKRIKRRKIYENHTNYKNYKKILKVRKVKNNVRIRKNFKEKLRKRAPIYTFMIHLCIKNYSPSI